MLAAVEVPTICMDVANGYSEHFVQVRTQARQTRQNTKPQTMLCAGIQNKNKTPY